MPQPQEFLMQPIARIRSDFAEKFGVPRQSGLVGELEAEIIFEPAYRNPAALRGLEDFSHIWLIWVFDRAIRETWSPTVRPPRLGGNTRMGVFATRSPFRPNPIALSCVKLAGIQQTAEGTVLRVKGADLVNGTPILDIKPYIPYADSHPEALGGFAAVPADCTLLVIHDGARPLLSEDVLLRVLRDAGSIPMFRGIPPKPCQSMSVNKSSNAEHRRKIKVGLRYPFISSPGAMRPPSGRSGRGNLRDFS